jgi:hypothetical protein
MKLSLAARIAAGAALLALPFGAYAVDNADVEPEAAEKADMEAEKGGAAPAAGMEKIEFEYPEPFFGGTPLDYFSPNLEERSWKPRPDFYAPKGAGNVALEKPVTSSDKTPEMGKLKFLTDGDKSYEEDSLLELEPGLQWVQVDLQEPCAIYAILLWHYHAAERVYFDVVIRVADDEDFTENVRTLFNNDHDNSSGLGAGEDKEYIEDYKGKLIEVGGVTARYVRFYSNGNTSDEFNHYVEAEIYGQPAE